MTGDVKFDPNKRTAIPGRTLVEVAIILPILLLPALDAMDFGRMSITNIVSTNAAREGANYFANYSEEKSANCTTAYAIISDEISNAGALKTSLVTTDIPVNCCTRVYCVGATPAIRALLGSTAGINISPHSKMSVTGGSR